MDLTAEFPENRWIRENLRYLCIPTLDADAPDLESIESALPSVLAAQGGIYIHCAAGHGRSASLAAVLLIHLGVETTLEGVLERLKKARPKIGLSRPQLRLVSRFADSAPAHRDGVSSSPSAPGE